MKNLKSTSLIICLCFIIASCGPSAKETETIKKAIADSVRKAIEDETIVKKLREDSIAAANAFEAKLRAEKQAAAEAARAEKEAALIQYKGDLEAAYIKFEDIKGFKLGRAKWEKENEVRTQAQYIESLKLEIKKLEAQLN